VQAPQEIWRESFPVRRPNDLQVFKKLAGPGAVLAAVPDGQPAQLGLVIDDRTGHKYLADCGAVYSILPYSSAAAPTGPALVTASKAPVPCWGRRTCQVVFGGRRFRWSFLLAQVSFPFLGAGFLKTF